MSDLFDLFIIHVADDARVALELAEGFELLGYRAWCYELDSLPLGSYIENIRRGIETASVLLVLVSQGSLDRDQEVTREIHFGQAGDKPFIPVVLGLSDAEFDDKVPLTWRQAFGNAVRVRIQPGQLAPAIRRIAEGLKAREVKPREVSDSRITAIRDAIEGLPAPEPVGWKSGGRGAGLRRIAGAFWRRRSAILVAGAAIAAIVAASLLWQRPSQPPPPREPVMNIWIVNPTFDGAPDKEFEKEFDILRRTMEENLLKVAGASNVKMQILNDEDIEHQLVNLGCPDVTKKFKIPDCAEKKVIDSAAIFVKVEPTFRGSTDGKRDLALRIGRGGGAEVMPNSESLKDANLTTLADWSAEQIARFLSMPRERIADVLGRQRENSRLLEDTLGSAAPPHGPGGTSYLPSLVGSALAGERPSAAADGEIRNVLERLRAALETENADNVAPVFSSMPPDQRAALQRYFDNVDQLKVAFGPPDITVQGDTARAAFLRQDQFKDRQSGERTSLAIRLVAVLVRENGAWKVQSLQKPA